MPFDWKRFLADIGRGFAGLGERPEDVQARQYGMPTKDFQDMQREAAMSQQLQAESDLHSTNLKNEAAYRALEEETANVEAWGGAQPATTVRASTGEARPTGEFDRSKPGVYLDHPATSAYETKAQKELAIKEEDRERDIGKEDWAKLQDVINEEFKGGREARLTKGQKAREDYQKGMLKIAERAQSLRERKAEDAQEVDTKYPHVTKGMHGLILDRAKSLMENEAFGVGGEFEGMNVGEWIEKETESWNFNLDPVSQEFASPDIGVPEPPIPVELQQPEEAQAQPEQPMATIQDIPDENIKRQLGPNFLGTSDDFEKLMYLLDNEGVFDGPPEQHLSEIQRRLGPFANELFKYQDSMNQNAAL